jgi:hypothetical protein
MIARRLLLVLLTLMTAAVTCTSRENGANTIDVSTSFSAQMASSWHYAGAPQRVQVGILASDADGVRPVTQGTVDVGFSHLGDGGGEPAPGPTATASYVPVPGTEASGSVPTLVSGANGVYEAEDVTFDAAGVWRATIAIEIEGVLRELTTDFAVSQGSLIPAPGMPAPRTETLTLDAEGVRPGAIDSMADGGGQIPDPELHEWSIADAIEQGRPALVLFGTPAYCTSRFCGPEVTELQRLAAEHPDRAVYIHVEIWKQYDPPDVQVVNRGAAEWLLRELPDGTPEMTEPWLFLIGADGIVADRWGPLFDAAEVAAALEALPPMEA